MNPNLTQRVEQSCRDLLTTGEQIAGISGSARPDCHPGVVDRDQMGMLQASHQPHLPALPGHHDRVGEVGRK
jgi:hypothetical protein